MSHYVHLGAVGLNIDDAVSTISQRVSDRVASEVTRAAGQLTTTVSTAVDRGVERMSTAAGVGLDRFLDSPAGTALFNKIEDKVDAVGTSVVKKHKLELALLGMAGLSFFMGGSNLAGRLGPRGTRVAFAVGGVALALVASGVFAPSDELPVVPPKTRLPAR